MGTAMSEMSQCQCNKASENCQHVTSEWSTLVTGLHPEEGSGKYGYPDAPEMDSAKAVAPILPAPTNKVVLEGGATYEGAWSGQHREGQGTLTLPDGGKYVGQFVQDAKHGKGVYYYPGGSLYSGQWLSDLQNGHGEERWQDGSIFQGSFRNGEKQGMGKFTWSNLCRYEGEFDHNDMHGEGVYHWNDGRGYSGQWMRNVMTKRGTMWWADGRRYEGEFAEGRKHGKGLLRWPDSRYYAGQWFQGRQHGVGIASNNCGLKRESRWFEGEFVEFGAEVAGGEAASNADATRHPLFDRLQAEAYSSPGTEAFGVPADYRAPPAPADTALPTAPLPLFTDSRDRGGRGDAGISGVDHTPPSPHRKTLPSIDLGNAMGAVPLLPRLNGSDPKSTAALSREGQGAAGSSSSTFELCPEETELLDGNRGQKSRD